MSNGPDARPDPPRRVRSITNILAAASAPCLTSSFQAECVVLTHLLLKEQARLPVLFLDTVHHFADTYRYRDELTAAWNLNLVTLRAAEPRPGSGRRARRSAAPCTRSDRCSPRSNSTTCGSRPSGASSPPRGRTCRSGAVPPAERTIHPASQSAGGMDHARCVEYAKAHEIPLMPLYATGYTSIGCEPCTTPPLDPENPRSGRWQGQSSSARIHIQARG
jgi:phosphoadenosine phosphosulfate reductase